MLLWEMREQLMPSQSNNDEPVQSWPKVLAIYAFYCFSFFGFFALSHYL